VVNSLSEDVYTNYCTSCKRVLLLDLNNVGINFSTLATSMNVHRDHPCNRLVIRTQAVVPVKYLLVVVGIQAAGSRLVLTKLLQQ